MANNKCHWFYLYPLPRVDPGVSHGHARGRGRNGGSTKCAGSSTKVVTFAPPASADHQPESCGKNSSCFCRGNEEGRSARLRKFRLSFKKSSPALDLRTRSAALVFAIRLPRHRIGPGPRARHRIRRRIPGSIW